LQLQKPMLELATRRSLEAYTAALGYMNAPFHREWYRLLTPENSPDHFSPLRAHYLAMKQYHLEGPRKHAKSECVAINYPSWLIGRSSVRFPIEKCSRLKGRPRFLYPSTQGKHHLC